jgi:hypothetical protein
MILKFAQPVFCGVPFEVEGLGDSVGAAVAPLVGLDGRTSDIGFAVGPSDGVDVGKLVGRLTGNEVGCSLLEEVGVAPLIGADVGTSVVRAAGGPFDGDNVERLVGGLVGREIDFEVGEMRTSRSRRRPSRRGGRWN